MRRKLRFGAVFRHTRAACQSPDLSKADDLRDAWNRRLSYGFWQKEYGGRDVVGKTVSLDNQSVRNPGRDCAWIYRLRRRRRSRSLHAPLPTKSFAARTTLWITGVGGGCASSDARSPAFPRARRRLG